MTPAESRYLWNRAAEPVRREVARCRAGESRADGALPEMLATLARIGTELIRSQASADRELVSDISEEIAGIQRTITAAV